MRCPDCDKSNIPGAQLCENCGLELAGLDLPEAAGGFIGRLLTDKIADLSVISPLTVSGEARVSEVIEVMRREHHGCVLVKEEGRLTGIFTERDVLTQIVAKGLDPSEVPVHDVMTRDPYRLEPVDPPAFAIHRMVVSGLRHLPVVEGEELRGFLSMRSVLRYIHDDVIAH